MMQPEGNAGPNPPTGTPVTIDTNLYSRQIGAFGMEAMGRLMQLRVLISGLNGVGAECAKNLILAGPKVVGIHDPKPARGRDLASTFCISEEAVKNGTTRAAASISYLSNLNQYVEVHLVEEEDISEGTVSEYDAVVLCEGTSTSIRRMNDICRSMEPPRGFIACGSFGLSCFVFCDFGPKFKCRDTNGEEPKEAIIAGITFEKDATVYTHTDKLLPFQDGDYVSFKEVKGMVELNSQPPQRIKVTGKHSFSIGDTTGFSPYQTGGIVRQVKMPKDITFRSWAESELRPLADQQTMLVVPDLSKFGRSEQLHFAVMALLKLKDERQVPHPVLYSETATARGREAADAAKAAADACVERAIEIAKELLDQARQLPVAEGVVTVDKLDESLIEKVVRFSPCCISPIAAFLGGVVAQEVVKLTGKYMPLTGFLYLDAFECLLPDDVYTELQRQERGALLQGLTNLSSLEDWRVADQVAIFGEGFQQQMSDTRAFIVGAGALGCELLKAVALMGVGCGGSGCVTVTDMDRIEVSNLNRQFLFRREHVGKPKSATAAQAAKAMNPSLNVTAMEARVGPETESTSFPDEFWQSQDVMVNALDNIQARQYVDSRCVAFGKPLLESGTLGTKGNVQVVVPHKTQCYSDSMDPPEESIPLCTLRHFPHAIEHTIEWSRDAFQGLFTDKIADDSQFAKDPKAFIMHVNSEGSLTQQIQRLEQVLEATRMYSFTEDGSPRPPSFAQCVKRAVFLFHDLFFCQIKHLLSSFPLDHRTTSGMLFWSPPKRAPTAIEFDASQPLHREFVVAAANLFAFAYGIPEERDENLVARLAQDVSLPPFVEKKIQIVSEEQEEDRLKVMDLSAAHCDEESRRKFLEEELLKIQNTSQMVFNPSEFEKDCDTNFHVDFVHAAAMLRAANYSIEACDKHKTKLVAGRIIPAIATTTAMVTGLVSLELIKVLHYKRRPIEQFKNAFANLALPLWLLSEPVPPIRATDKEYDPVAGGPVRALPQGFTCWDKVDIDIPECTVRQLMDFVSSKFDVNVDLISVGNFCLYNSYIPGHKKQRLDMAIKALVQEVTKAPVQSRVIIESSCTARSDGTDVLIPTIVVHIRKT